MATKSDSTIESVSSNGKLPEGWRMVQFGDVVRDVKESERNPLDAGLKRYIGLEHIEPENLHIKEWGDLTQDEVSFTKRFRKGQVLFGKRRAYQRKVALAEFDGICSSDILTFEPKDDALIPDLLPFIVQSDAFFDHALGTSSGSLSPRTRWSQLKDFQLPLPPRSKQQSIADALIAVVTSIQKLRISANDAIKAKDVVAAHLLREGFAGSKVVDTPIGQVPETWNVVPLGEVADVRYGLTINKKRESLPLRRPYLRVANVHRAFLDLEEVKSVGCSDSDLKDFVLKENDVLVVEGHADVHEIGRAALWSEQIGECLHQNHILRVRCKASLVPKFALAWLNSPRGRSYFFRFSQSTSGLNTINSTVLKKMLFPLPPIDTQHQLCNLVETIEDVIASHANHLERLRLLLAKLRETLLFPYKGSEVDA